MLDNQTIQKIQEMYQYGIHKKDISKKLNVSIATISKYTKDVQILYDDMVGKSFGNLEVLYRAEKRKDLSNRCIRYVCRCKCGKIIEVNGNSLRTGHTTSCGCSRKNSTIKDLTGLTFGKLKVLYNIEERKDNKVQWVCECECGKKIIVTSSALLQNKIKSCGCSKESLGEMKIKNELQKTDFHFIQQYKFLDCKYKSYLLFDFAIFDKNNNLLCLIEYQGDIHFKSTGGWNTQESLIERQKRDLIKRQYCKKNNIRLIEILYTDYNKISKEYLERLIYDKL